MINLAKTSRFLAVTLVSFAAAKVLAFPISAGLNIGKPLVFVDTNTEQRKSLGAKASLGLDVNLYIPEYPFAAGVYYETFVASTYGPLPVSNGGLQLSYYPFGKPLVAANEAGQVFTKKLGMTVYGTVGSGLTFMNINDGKQTILFGAAAMNLRLSATLEYPLSETWSGGGTLLYQTTFGGTDGQLHPVTVGYTGWSLLARFVITLN